MSIRDDFVEYLEKSIAEITQQLKPLTSGRVRLWAGPPGGPSKDITAQEIKRLKESIRGIESVVAQYRDKE